RKLVGLGPTLVIASPELLEEEHGAPYLSWELRGGHVCIDEGASWPQPSVRYVITEGEHSVALFPRLRIVRREPSYALWKVTGRIRKPLPGKGPCPLIAERQARQGPAR